MSTFRSLHTALQLRSREEDLARNRLAEAWRARQTVAQQLATAVERHDRVQQMLRRSDGDEVPVSVFATGRTWLAAARAEIARLRDRLGRADELCEQRRSELLDAARRRKTLQRLIERRRAELLHQQQLMQQRELDEIAAMGAKARRGLSPDSGSLALQR